MSSLERMVQDDRLVAIRTCGNDVHRCFDDFLDAADVVARIGWQVIQRTRAEGGFLPARHFFVDRFQRVVTVKVGEASHRCGVVAFVANADFYLVEAVEYVELGETDTADTVDANRQFDGGGIEPATAAIATGGSADLLAFAE